MKAMMLNAKAALSSHKDNDQQYVTRVEAVQKLGSALTAFERSNTKLKSAAKDTMDAIDALTEAYKEFTTPASVPQEYRDAVIQLQEAAVKLRSGGLAELTTKVDHTIAPAFSALKKAQSECKELENEHDKKYSEYITYKDAAEKKEAEYSKKGKDLTSSKAYQEEVSKRDAAKHVLDENSARYTMVYEEMMDKSNEVSLTGFKDLCSSFAAYYSAIAQLLDNTEKSASNVKL